MREIGNNHRTRSILAVALIQNGLSDRKISNMFKIFEDFDEKITLNFVRHLRKIGARLSGTSKGGKEE